MMKGVAKVAPGEGHVQVIDVPEPQVKAAGICGTDLHIYYDEFKTRPPVITEWAQAFERFEKRDGFKLLLTPVD